MPGGSGRVYPRSVTTQWQPADEYPAATVSPEAAPAVAPALAPLAPAASGLAPLAPLSNTEVAERQGTAVNGAHGPADWLSGSQSGPLNPRSAVEVLSGLSAKVNRGEVTEYQPIPMGLTPLDRTLGGGLRAGELILIGGAQGAGKTTMSLQVARNIAQSGQANVLYICFEHDEEYLLNRMIAMESALASPMPPSANSAVKIQDVRREVLGTWMANGGDPNADLRANPRLRPAVERISRYGQGLFLMRGSHTNTTPENLRILVEGYQAERTNAATGRVRRLPPARPDIPGSADRGREGDQRGRRAQGPGPVARCGGRSASSLPTRKA